MPEMSEKLPLPCRIVESHIGYEFPAERTRFSQPLLRLPRQLMKENAVHPATWVTTDNQLLDIANFPRSALCLLSPSYSVNASQTTDKGIWHTTCYVLTLVTDELVYHQLLNNLMIYMKYIQIIEIHASCTWDWTETRNNLVKIFQKCFIQHKLIQRLSQGTIDIKSFRKFSFV